MATSRRHTQRIEEPAAANGMTARTGRGTLELYRERLATRKRARLISPRSRRDIAQRLRRTAEHTPHPDPLARHRETLLHYRVAAARTDLLEIAGMLERAHDPDLACMTALRELLTNGCDSPLYNSDIHVSELLATLHGVRAALVTQA